MGTHKFPRVTEDHSTFTRCTPKAGRELVLTVVLLSALGLPALGKEGALHSSLPNPPGSSGSALSGGAHGQSLAPAILGQGAPAWQAGCRDLCLTTATGSGAARAAGRANLPQGTAWHLCGKDQLQGKTEPWHCQAGAAGLGIG